MVNNTDKSFNYTEKMEKIFRDKTEKFKSFYCREDAEGLLREYKTAEDDEIAFVMDKLETLCEGRGFSAEELVKNKKLLEEIPLRDEVIESLAEVVYALYDKVPSSEEYMERIVRRLAPEYKNDTIRCAILKKFLKGAGLKWKTMSFSGVEGAVVEKMTDDEKAEYEKLSIDEKCDKIIEKIDESIFKKERLESELGMVTITELMIKRIGLLKKAKGTTFNLDKEPAAVDDFAVREETKAAILAFCDKYGVEYSKENSLLTILENIGEYCKKNEQDSICGEFFALLEKDFNLQMRSVLYVNSNGRLDKAAELFKTDKKTAKKKALGKDWEILILCDNLAKGRFKTNGGKTREYLYYFAIMFDMSIVLKKDDVYDADTDFEKNLFKDYYNDNLIRYISEDFKDPKKISGFEKEPVGDGINYKNFVEVIFLYYLYRKDLPLTPGKRIDEALKLIARCESAAKEKKDILTESIREFTGAYKKMYITKLVDKSSEELFEYLIENYLVFDITEKNSSAKITIESEMNTAYETMNDMLEELESDAEYYHAGASIDYGEMVKQTEYIEDAKFAKGAGIDWSLSAVLRKKYIDDADFIKVLDNIDRRVGEDGEWITDSQRQLMVRMLNVLYHKSSEQIKVSMEKLKNMLTKYDVTCDGAAIGECAEILMRIGFDVHKESNKEKGYSEFYLGASDYEDEDLDAVMDIVKRRYLSRTEDAYNLLSELIERKLPEKRKVNRSTFIVAYVKYYINQDSSSYYAEDFPSLYADFTMSINDMLEDARFQPFSEKNLFDMYILLSVYIYFFNKKE